jgi:hypothetical protein
VSQDYFRLQRDATLGNTDALVFLLCWTSYCHSIDDLVDEAFNVELLVDTCMQANAMYSTPFWLANSARLSGIVGMIANAYADSERWKGGPELWKSSMADVLRQAGNEMLLAVAMICGGWRHMRSISLQVRETAYHEQHEVTHG